MTTTSTQWSKMGKTLQKADTSAVIPQLENKIYSLHFNDMSGLYLTEEFDSFEHNYKVYGLRQDFINRAIKTWDKVNANLGILLNGVKGTGKTVTSQILCNKFNLPVIAVNANLPGLANFLGSIHQEVIILFDEFEKNFGGGSEDGDYKSTRTASTALLTLMDGVMKSEYRKVFLLTTNQKSIDDNFMQRPGRLRYIVTFDNLTQEQILEIVEDKLSQEAKAMQLLTPTIKYIAQLELITVDIVSAICNEVNIHLEEPERFADVFNAKKVDIEYNVEKLTKGKDGEEDEFTPYAQYQKFATDLDEYEVGEEFYCRGYQGDILEVDLDARTVVVEYGTDKRTFRITKLDNTNIVFRSYTF